MNLDHQIGEKLRSARTAAGMCHRDAARRLDLTELELKQLEMGTKRMPANLVHRAAQTFDVEIRWFFENLPGNLSGTVRSFAEETQRDTASTSMIASLRLNSTLSKLCEAVRESDYQGISRKFVA